MRGKLARINTNKQVRYILLVYFVLFCRFPARLPCCSEELGWGTRSAPGAEGEEDKKKQGHPWRGGNFGVKFWQGLENLASGLVAVTVQGRPANGCVPRAESRLVGTRAKWDPTCTWRALVGWAGIWVLSFCSRPAPRLGKGACFATRPCAAPTGPEAPQCRGKHKGQERGPRAMMALIGASS